jgi:uncharacterized damage-inducible protein DinB
MVRAHMDLDMHQAAISTLASTPAVLRSMLAAQAAELAHASADGGWTPKDVVAHLIVAEQRGAIGRIRTIAVDDGAPLEAYDEEHELARPGLRALSIGDLLVRFAAMREGDVAWLRGLDAATFARSGRHSAVGMVSAEELLQHAAYHDCLHVGQLADMLRARFEPLRGAMRVY